MTFALRFAVRCSQVARQREHAGTQALRWDQGCLLEGLGRARDTEETHGETRHVAPGTRALQARAMGAPRVGAREGRDVTVKSLLCGRQRSA